MFTLLTESFNGLKNISPTNMQLYFFALACFLFLGITTIITAVGEEAETIEEVYEPFLIQEGYMIRTPRGREVTEMAYKHLGRNPLNRIGGLFGE